MIFEQDSGQVLQRAQSELIPPLPSHALAEASSPAGDALLLIALDCQAVGFDVTGDHRSSTNDRAVADRHRRHQRGIGTDERALADVGLVLAEAVVIAGDRARPDVSLRSD